MNGNKYFLDTNAIIALLQGNSSLKNSLFDAEWIGVSVISALEFLSFPDLSLKDKFVFFKFLDRVELIGVLATDLYLLESLADLKKTSSLKLPDAIIAGYAIKNQSILVSNDS